MTTGETGDRERQPQVRPSHPEPAPFFIRAREQENARPSGRGTPIVLIREAALIGRFNRLIDE